MSDPLAKLFQARFAGHELDVPPDAWDNISGQLAASAGDEAVRHHLREKFQGHEVGVDPSAWAHISGQLGHAGVAGTSMHTGWIAAGAAAIALTAGLLMWNHQGAAPSAALPPPPPAVEQQAATPLAAGKPVETNAPADATAPAPLAAEKPSTGQGSTQATDAGATASITTSSPSRPTEASVEATSGEATTGPVVQGQTEPQEVRHEATVHPVAAPAPAARIEPRMATGQPDAPKPATATEEIVPDPSPTAEQQVPAPGVAAMEVDNDIFIPNVFSPQGDGVNDKLKIVADNFERVDVRVFSAKSGALVFRSNDLAAMWDGRMPNGNIAEEGYYRCVVLLTGADGRNRVKTEVVRLYR